MKHWRLTACGIILLAVQGQAQSPVLSYAVPAAVKPGEVTEVTFHGEKLAGVSKLWTSFPCQSVRVESAVVGGRVKFRLTVPREVQPGFGAVRLAGTNGISSLLLLGLDGLSAIAEGGPNTALTSAQMIQPPVAIDGMIEDLGSDYFKFTARKGQRLAVEVVAQRIGSRLDPVVRLLDAKGRELAYCDDEPGLGSDARLAWQCPASGEYALELRDILYQGGTQHRYRLRVGGAPLPATGVEPREHRLPEVSEVEPNDNANTATPFTVPALLTGRFGKDRDRDFYQFAVSNDQRLIFRAKTRSLGSPCEVFMQVQKPDGSKVAEARASAADEGNLTNKFNQAGTYLLLVEELNRRGRSDFAYRVEVEPLHPGFALGVETDKVEAVAGGRFELKVSCARREYDGPIELSLDGTGEGFTLENAVIGDKKTNTVMKARVPARLVPGELLHFHVVGRARIAGMESRSTASTLPALRKLFPQTSYPPAELDGLIGLGIKSASAKD